jgi:aspartokinase
LAALIWIDEKFDALDEVLRGLAAIRELTPRISDLIVSHGERLSSRIVTAAFRERGINAAHVDARESSLPTRSSRRPRRSTTSSRSARRKSCCRWSPRARFR